MGVHRHNWIILTITRQKSMTILDREKKVTYYVSL